ncbi:hypothetical protein [Streptomyces mirabilis]|uniref:hypothetical protein n=1 Tax=Streptomyces mirabilis TaxID=68239 RepID=UPI003408FFCE
MTTDQPAKPEPAPKPEGPTAYCGHDDCVQAVKEWIEAGHPEITYERGGCVMTHRSEVLFYARRDWLANRYVAALAGGRDFTREERGAYVMRDRERLRAEQRATRRRARQNATQGTGATR